MSHEWLFQISLSQNRGWITWFELALYHLIAGASFEAVRCFFQQILVGQRFPVGWAWMHVRFLDWLLHIQPGVDFDTLFQQIWVRGLYEITGSYSYCIAKFCTSRWYLCKYNSPSRKKSRKATFAIFLMANSSSEIFFTCPGFCPKKTRGLLSYFNRRS